MDTFFQFVAPLAKCSGSSLFNHPLFEFLTLFTYTITNVVLSILSNILIKRTGLFCLYINLMFDVNTFLYQIFVTCLKLLAISKYHKPFSLLSILCWTKGEKQMYKIIKYNNHNSCLDDVSDCIWDNLIRIWPKC